MATETTALATEIAELDRLRWASWAEATTLLALLFVAVPLRHIYGLREATQVAGPIHGLAFLLFVLALTRAASGYGWTGGETLRALIAAFLPFGGFVNERRLRRRQAELAAKAKG